MALTKLDESVLLYTISHCSLHDLFKLTRTSKNLRRCLYTTDGETESVWRQATRTLWSDHISLGQHFTRWIDAARWLETTAYNSLVAHGVKSTLNFLANQGMLSLEAQLTSWATPITFDIVRAAMRYRQDLECRRRVTAFACSSSFSKILPPDDPDGSISSDSSDDDEEQSGRRQRKKRHNLLDCLLRDFNIGKTRDPEDALRQLLMEFPFLPIDAGQGADRVIKAVAREYLRTHPDQFQSLREGQASDCREEDHNDAVSLIYILLYAIIMVNTDLHNPAIKRKHKMTCDRFVRNTKCTVLAEAFSNEELSRMYWSIAQAPLRICSVAEHSKGLKNLNIEACHHENASFSTRQSQQSLRTSLLAIKLGFVTLFLTGSMYLFLCQHTLGVFVLGVTME